MFFKPLKEETLYNSNLKERKICVIQILRRILGVIQTSGEET